MRTTSRARDSKTYPYILLYIYTIILCRYIYVRFRRVKPVDRDFFELVDINL